MFDDLLDTCVGYTDVEVIDALRATELEDRELAARRAALVAVAEQRGLHRAHEHRSGAGFLRAHWNRGDGSISRDRKLARLLDAHPRVGEALLAGHVSVDHAVQIARIQSNSRISHLLVLVLPGLLDDAEHLAHGDFKIVIDEFIAQVDADGAFADLAAAVEGRNAHVSDVAGSLVVDMSGGDPITTAQFIAVFEAFVDGEYQRDLQTRRELHGDDAVQYPLARTAAQRRFDALVTMAAAAAASPDGRALPEPTVHIVIDDTSAHETLTHAGVLLPSGQMLDDDLIDATDDTLDRTMHGLAEELLTDPDAYRNRRCRTSTGAAMHPMIALRALLTGHVRRVVVDSRGVIIDHGTKQRLFTGHARDAALLLATTCVHPGCRLPARMCQVDHVTPWPAGGPTNQDNGNIECGPHNLHKHRAGWTTRRDDRGRTYNITPDGTIILPVGERPPDLTHDEAVHLVRQRLRHQLTAA